MREIDLIEERLPGFCPSIFSLGMGFCGVSFKNFENLYQDTDGTVYCTNCGIVIGVYKKKTVPFRRRDDNALP